MAGSTHTEDAVRRLQATEALQLAMPGPLAAGQDLSGDHPAFDLAPEARRAASDALEAGETHYADVPGIAPLRDAVAGALAGWGMHVDAEQGLIIASGEQEARFLALHALAHVGYGIVLPSIVHPGARKAAALGQVKVSRVPLVIDAISHTLASGKNALYLESPNRLTGKIIEGPLVRAIAEEAVRADAIVIWDASLAPWVPEDSPYELIGTLPGMAERTITIGTLWSGAGVEGWLAAYLAGPPALFGRARNLKQIIAICTTTPAQWGVLGVLKAGTESLITRRAQLRRIKSEAASQFPAGVLAGEATSVLAVRPPGDVDPRSLAAKPMAGEAFGAPGILRFTVTPTGEVVGALRAIAARQAAGGGDLR